MQTQGQPNLQDPSVKQAIRAALGEASASLTRIEAERDLIKEIAKKMNEDHDITKRTFNRLLKAYHKQSFQTDVTELNEFTDLYERLFGG